MGALRDRLRRLLQQDSPPTQQSDGSALRFAVPEDDELHGLLHVPLEFPPVLFRRRAPATPIIASQKGLLPEYCAVRRARISVLLETEVPLAPASLHPSATSFPSKVGRNSEAPAGAAVGSRPPRHVAFSPESDIVEGSPPHVSRTLPNPPEAPLRTRAGNASASRPGIGSRGGRPPNGPGRDPNWVRAGTNEADPASTPGYKTALCKFWPSDCRMGDMCTFAHGDEELQSYNSNRRPRNERNRDESPADEVNRLAWMRDGTQSSFGPSGGMGSGRPSSGSARVPQGPCRDEDGRRPTVVCDFFLRDGGCRHGEQCKFFHPPSSAGEAVRRPQQVDSIKLERSTVLRGGGPSGRNNLHEQDRQLSQRFSCHEEQRTEEAVQEEIQDERRQEAPIVFTRPVRLGSGLKLASELSGSGASAHVDRGHPGAVAGSVGTGAM